MTGGVAFTSVCSVPVSFSFSTRCSSDLCPVCVVPRLFEQARWCTRTSPVLVIPAKAGIHFGRQVPHDDGFPPARECGVERQELLFVQCQYRLGNVWSVWMATVVFAECPECLSKAVAAPRDSESTSC